MNPTWHSIRVLLIVVVLSSESQIGAAELPTNPEKLKPTEAVDAYLAVVQDAQQTSIKRNYAAARIVEIGEPALPRIVELYGKASTEQRGYLASIMGAMDKTDRTETVLLKDLKKNGLKAHPNVIKALGDIGSEKARPVLLGLLRDAPKDVRPRLLYTLGKVADESVAETLFEGLDAPDRFARLACANGILTLLTKDKQKVDSAKAAKAYRSLLDKVLKYCERGDKADVRMVLIRGVARLNESDAVDTLLRVLDDGAPALQVTAANALGTLKARAAVDELTDALFEENASLQRAALSALVTIGDRQCVPILIDFLETRDAARRKETVKALQALTAQKFGDNPEAWKRWWGSQ